jgi:spermidine/putrescine transport system substrate-binding protein
MAKKLYIIMGVIAVISVVVGYAVGNYLTGLSFRDYEAELKARIQELQVKLGMPPVEEEVRVYTWSWYINPYMIELFKKVYGVKRVIYKTFESDEEVWAKISTNASGYDVVCISDAHVAMAARLNYIQKLNKTLIPNIEYIDDKFKNAYYDPGCNYSVPYMWGTTGIGYDKSLVNDTITGWKQLFDFSPGGFLEKYRGKITMLDDWVECFSAALKYLGYNASDTKPEHLQEAKELLIRQKQYLKQYAGADLYIPFMQNPEVSGFWICHVWNGDLYIAKDGNPNLVYVLPEEGGILWIDTWVIPTGALHPIAAHAWINFLSDPLVSALNSMYIHYASPIKRSIIEKLIPQWTGMTADPGIYPTDEMLKKFEIGPKIYTDEEREYIEQLWIEVKLA